VSTAMKDFQRFLSRAEKTTGVLPSWWSATKRKECEKVAAGMLKYAVEKSDLVEEYGDLFIAERLIALAEEIYGDE